MKYEEVSWYSPRLEREMRIKVYGHYGPAFIAFPCQDKQSDDFYNNGMIDALKEFLDAGKMKLFCLDSNDDETVSSHSENKALRAFKIDMYHHYLMEEVLPFVYSKQYGYDDIYLIGMSMGADHALNNFLRRPERFKGCIALSGGYDLTYFYDGYMDENIYNNSIIHYLANMDNNHPYIEIYNSKKVYIEVGNGLFEFLVRDTNVRLKEIWDSKNIHFNFEFWDENSVHDWSSWKYAMPYFIKKILG